MSSITEVHLRTWQGAYAHVFPRERLAALDEQRPRRERFWREAIENPVPRRHVLVAEEAGRVVGFVSVGPDHTDGSVGELYAIYVLPERWGRGAGPALMAHGLERLRAERFPKARLWVLEDNPRARAFYEREGWSLDGEARDETFLDTPVREVRYSIELRDAVR